MNNENINKDIDNEEIKEFLAFKEVVLNNSGELDDISTKLAYINQSEDYLETLDFFFGYYFPEKYGKNASKFLFNLLANSSEIIEVLTESKVLDKIDQIELELIAYKHNELIRKLSSKFEHPYGLMSTSSVNNGEGEYLLSIKRIDGESFNLFLDNSQCYRLASNLIESTLENLDDIEMDENVIGRFLRLSEKAKHILKNKER
ncbi:hypothetical protein [Priestia flexa]|uniref:Uncharacterized protein n=1 Tax=Priestia flexa TaxID=86664 RepID=A0ABU4JAY3_9BACI|nr:hypothetical protein [Priestia flexa]MCA1202528.1 hypothetical protein [Priestia flexa]MDW8518172.1 hypothetical protein [Priestia flexa]